MAKSELSARDRQTKKRAKNTTALEKVNTRVARLEVFEGDVSHIFNLDKPKPASNFFKKVAASKKNG